MFLYVDLQEFILLLYTQFANILVQYYRLLDSIYIVYVQGYAVTLLDFVIGVVVIGIVLGAFLRINRSDKFYQ